MIRKATAKAPSNIAFTKYWGRKDDILRLPENGSIAMTLSNMHSTTTVEFSPKFDKDLVILNGASEEGESSKVIKHLDRVRKMANLDLKAKIVSTNNFPTATGLSSSASGFAALTLSAFQAAGLKLSKKQLSILARQGSGSACRSIPDGFVEWLDGDSSESSYAKEIFPINWWKISDVVAVVSEGRKEISTSKAHELAKSSPFQKVRVERMRAKNALVKKLIKKRSFKDLGELVEAEALELHAIMITQTPPLIYWLPGTLVIMKLARKWREEGLPVYFTVNTGQDIHLICQQKDEKKVSNLLSKLPEVKKVITNHPSRGAYLLKEHLF